MRQQWTEMIPTCRECSGYSQASWAPYPCMPQASTSQAQLRRSWTGSCRPTVPRSKSLMYGRRKPCVKFGDDQESDRVLLVSMASTNGLGSLPFAHTEVDKVKELCEVLNLRAVVQSLPKYSDIRDHFFPQQDPSLRWPRTARPTRSIGQLSVSTRLGSTAAYRRPTGKGFQGVHAQTVLGLSLSLLN